MTPLVSPYLLLHDLALLILAAILLVEATLSRPESLAAGRVRLALAFVWVTCMVAPAVTARVIPLPVAPIGALVLGWLVFVAARRAAAEPSPVVGSFRGRSAAE